jgi:hypothetical protein
MPQLANSNTAPEKRTMNAWIQLLILHHKLGDVGFGLRNDAHT